MIYILYHPNSEHARIVEEFAHNFERQGGTSVELLSLETRDGSSMASLYDVVQYPAVLVLGPNGQILKNWEGQNLPLINEVAGYAHAGTY